jgi:hypothetical protein
MKTYLLISKIVEGEGVFFGYDEDGLLVRFEIRGKATKLQIAWLHKNLPTTSESFLAFKKMVENSGQKAKIVEVQPDLSFEKFWEAYNYKVGKKAKAKQIWDGMEQGSKVAAMEYIKKYNRWLSDHISVEKQYPTTYLNTKAWEN